jgi:carboxyl-terminal processing protease
MRLVLIGIFLAAFPLLSQPASNLQLEAFDAVWTTVRDKHWNPKQLEALPGGGSWEGLREQYRPLVAQAPNAIAARELMRQMLARLGRSHYAVIGFEPNASRRQREGGPVSPGFRVELVEGQILVTAVEAGSPAALAGVKTGWKLMSVEDTPLAPVLSELQAQAATMIHYPLRLHQILNSQVSGDAGETLAYEFEDGLKKRQALRIELPNSKASAGFGFMQGIHVESEFRLLTSPKSPEKSLAKTGYFRLSHFLDLARVMVQFEQAVKACTACRGFIIDVRGNPGGLAVMANSLSGWFVSQQGLQLGTMYQRDFNLNFAVIPRLEALSIPVAVLIDEASASTSEIFAGGLQDLGRARVFGSRSAGAALPSLIERLPNGDLFQYAVANYVSQGGKELEGNGVAPDRVVSHTRAALLASKDNVLNAALDWIYAVAPKKSSSSPAPRR